MRRSTKTVNEIRMKGGICSSRSEQFLLEDHVSSSVLFVESGGEIYGNGVQDPVRPRHHNSTLQ